MKPHLNEEATWLDKRVSSSFLFILGLLTAPALVLTRPLVLKGAQTLLYIGLARWRKQRLFLAGGLIFLTATVVFSLFNPLGRVLIEAGGLQITEGALRSGLSRGLTVLSLLYLSRFSVRSDLWLPGTLGMMVARTFHYLNSLLEAKKSFTTERRNWIEKIDHLLEKACQAQPAPEKKPEGVRTHWTGCTCLAVLTLLNWCFVFAMRWGIF